MIRNKLRWLRWVYICVRTENQGKSNYLKFYGDTDEERCKNLGNIIQTAFMNHFKEDIQESQVHNYYICKLRNCNISEDDKKKMSKDNKFQHKWLSNPDIACCKSTGIWSLCYIDNKGMFCSLCRIHNTTQPANQSRIWNNSPNTRCRPESIRGHLKDSSKAMHSDAVNREMLKQNSYFVQREKKKENLNTSYLTVF